LALIQIGFLSEKLKRKVHFNAILPIDPMFPMPVKLPLKTAYMLHGYTGSCDGWFTGHSLGKLATNNNIAIILPNAENHFYVDDEQRGDMHGEFIGSELVEFTRKIFPLSDKREDTIIGGISMGGYGALRNGLKYNDTFGHIVAISPAIITSGLKDSTDEPNPIGATRGYYESVFGDLSTATQRDIDICWLSEKMKREGASCPNIYLACGSNDNLVFESRRLHEHLTSLGITHVYEEGPGTHDDLFFDPHMAAGFAQIKNLDRPPEMPNPFWVD